MGDFVRVIFDSGLSPSLKTTAAAMVTFADYDVGTGMRPSVGRLAWMVGKSERQVRTDITKLIALGVIVATSARTGGRSRSTEYRLAIDQLPVRAPWKPARNPEVDRRVSPRNPEVDFRVSDHIDTPASSETRKSDPETRKCETTNPEVGFRLPYIDPPDQDQDQPAAPARSRSSDNEALPMPAFREYAAVAKVALDQALRDHRTDDLGTVGDLFKSLCARQGKPYDADITRKAVDAALHARDKARQDLMRVIRPAARRAMLRPSTSSPNTWRPWKTSGKGRQS